MIGSSILTTAEELWHLPDDRVRHELVAGQLRVMALAGAEHGRVISTVGWLLGTHVHATEAGVTLGPGTGFVLSTNPDTVRAPDIAFVSKTRADAIGRTDRFWPDAPDLAIEVLSPDDSHSDVRSKTLSWLDAGATAVLVLDPATRSAAVYRAGRDVQTFSVGVLDLSDTVPGWVVAVADFFA